MVNNIKLTFLSKISVLLNCDSWLAEGKLGAPGQLTCQARARSCAHLSPTNSHSHPMKQVLWAQFHKSFHQRKQRLRPIKCLAQIYRESSPGAGTQIFLALCITPQLIPSPWRILFPGSPQPFALCFTGPVWLGVACPSESSGGSPESNGFKGRHHERWQTAFKSGKPPRLGGGGQENTF